MMGKRTTSGKIEHSGGRLRAMSVSPAVVSMIEAMSSDDDDGEVSTAFAFARRSFLM